MNGRRLEWRREALLLSILAMDATWLAPWTALLTGTAHDAAHGVSMLGLFALLLGALLATRLLATSRLSLGAQQGLAGGLAIATGLLLTGARLYAHYPLAGLGWVPAWLGDLARLRGYGGGGLVLLGVSLYAWGRGISLAQNRLETAAVGFYLRWGIVAWFWFYLWGLLGQAEAPLAWLFLFFFFGLLAVGLSRVEEVHHRRGAVRSPFTVSWLLIMAGSACGASGLGFLGTLIISRRLLARLWLALGPLGAVLQWVLYRVVEGVFLLLAPFIEWLRVALAPTSGRLANMPTPAAATAPMPALQPTGLPLAVQALTWAILGLALLAIVVLVVTALQRREAPGALSGALETTWEAAGGPDGDRLGARLQRLRRRLGEALASARPPFYAQASVRQIYASLLRLAAWRGVPRNEAETPYEFERRLDGAWPEAEEAVGPITEAYVRARYGERRFSEAETEALRATWRRLRQSLDRTEA